MSAAATVAVVGAGPAALAAIHRLRSQPNLSVVAVAPDGAAEYLPAALAVATGDADPDWFRRPLQLDGVEVVPSAAEALGPGFVRVDGQDRPVDAVIAAPGLITDPVVPAAGSPATLTGFWDLAGAARAAPVIGAFDRGVLTVVIAAPLYRCPPAPYGLAIRLARRAARAGQDVRVRLSTPEPRPLAAIGSAVTELLLSSCAAAGVEIDFDRPMDPTALATGELVDRTGQPVVTDLAVVVPAHHRHPLLADLAGPDQRVTVDDLGRSDAAGVYVAGDAVAHPFPRAAGAARHSGEAAAEGVLVDLGLVAPEVDHRVPGPQLECFVDQGDGRFSRIDIEYPDGPPPEATPVVRVSGPASSSAAGVDAALDRWLRTTTDRPD